jgi:hypothetical protein
MLRQRRRPIPATTISGVIQSGEPTSPIYLPFRSAAFWTYSRSHESTATDGTVSPMLVHFGHSVRKACMGSIDAARRAGTKQAISVATQRRMATITNVSQSAVPTP